MTQEVGQAGSLNSASRTLGANVTASALPQSVTVSPAPATDVFAGEVLLVDTGAAQETVHVTLVGATTITGVFNNNHNNGAPIVAIGVFPQGVLTASTATNLKLFGDINGDGTLVYVEYVCNTVTGTLTRSVTPISSATINGAQVLVSNLVANPGGTPCFQYATSVTTGGYTFIPSLGITLTVQTADVNAETGLPLTVTKSFLNIAPRNVDAGIILATSGSTDNLQPTPALVTTLSAY
jgi:hypothetical protein